MEILNQFKRYKNGDITVYSLKKDKLSRIYEILPEKFRLCFISDSKLIKSAKANKMSKSEFLRKYVIPDKGNIKSGDFGEIFCYYTVIENYEKKDLQLFGPKKWRWKDKNKPAPYSDVVLFHKSKSKETQNDFVVTVESKMKATKSTKHRIQDAINDASKDRLTRLSKTLIWLEEKYAKLNMLKTRKSLERFNNPSKYGTYDKIHKAIAILDKKFRDEEFKKEINFIDGIGVIVFLIDCLQNTYEDTLLKIIESVADDE